MLVNALGLCSLGLVLTAATLTNCNVGSKGGENVPHGESPSVPTNVASSEPTSVASSEPPSVAPIEPPTVSSSEPPSVAPTEPPSVAPSEPTSVAPTEPPSVASSEPPSVAPTEPPSVAPSEPTSVPSSEPHSVAPTEPPSVSSSEPPTESSSEPPIIAPFVPLRVSPFVPLRVPPSVASELPSKMKLQVITWNVNGERAPKSQELEGLVDFALEPDMIVIGLQEVALTDMPHIRHNWRRTLDKAIQRNGYVLVKRKTMISLMNMVYVKAKYKELVSSDRQQTISIRHRIVKNKGGVSIRIVLGDVRMMFLVAHLPPHEQKETIRAEAIRLIYEEINKTIFPIRYTFLFGDLNFRLTNVEKWKVKRDLKDPDPEKYLNLLQNDEFLTLDKNEILNDMKEQDIKFHPTYKFSLQEPDMYDDERRPAWTDRVLYKETTQTMGDIFGLTARQDSITPVCYKSLEEYRISDHKPVRACFEINIKPDITPNN